MQNTLVYFIESYIHMYLDRIIVYYKGAFYVLYKLLTKQNNLP